jgi:Fur family ferric uptake transcriptional regulator
MLGKKKARSFNAPRKKDRFQSISDLTISKTVIYGISVKEYSAIFCLNTRFCYNFVQDKGEYTMKDAESILVQKGIRPTAMRLLILEYLQQQPSATGLRSLENTFDHADRITIYRTLKTFEENGVIHKIIDGSEEAKYAVCFEGCDESHHHDMHAHFKCRACHETFCLPEPVRLPILPAGFRVEEMSLVASGLCPRCK